MTINVFATDMDGTFLNDQNTYDQAYFAALFPTLVEKGMHFVAISGNQYYQIATFFEGYLDQMTVVGENGAYIVDKGKVLKSYPLPKAIVEQVIAYLEQHQLSSEAVVCGENSAYILASASQENKEYFSIYYTKLQEVASFQELPQDNILKFSFNTPMDVTEEIITVLNETLSGQVQAVATGHGNVDVIGRGVNKGTAMSFLLNHWGLKASNLVAFGDSDNDLEMLNLTDNSYAMLNANNTVKKVATYQTTTNNENGVLVVIDKLIRD
ncbi:Cof-type HAD-IIB family hydrolase [Streptococcus hongkongensis]